MHKNESTRSPDGSPPRLEAGQSAAGVDVRERAQEIVARVKEGLAPVDEWIRTLARERPVVALAGALGIGYLLGRVIRRVT